jgi:hypothetical protein
MIKYLRNTRKKLPRYVFLTALILLLSNCATLINSLTQPTTATVGQEITAILDVNFNVDGGPYTKQIIVGILAPKSWKIGENAKLTFSGDKGTGTFTLVPSNLIAAGAKNGENWATRMKNKFGIGTNFIDDMEWVPFQTTESLTANIGEKVNAKFQIKMKVGVDGLNTSVKLGYVVCNKDDGLPDDSPDKFAVKYSDCLEVTGGTGDLIDFCNPSLAVLSPVKVLDNDFETITFDNTVTTTDLKDVQNIYLCATAHTSDGQDIVVCSQEERSKMRVIAPNKFQITIWPRGYFNVPAGKTLTGVDYYFTDQGGAVKVGFGNTSTVPFKIKFLCD